jgi:hypothetical protein
MLSFCALRAQSPAYEYNGAPLAIPYTCTDDDIDWAGLTCVDDPCPIYIDASHAAGQGKSILVTGTFHTAATTMDSLLLRSDDGGRTWREPFARIRGAELDEIQVYDGQTAWVDGVIQQPVATDPFFLVTEDGGASWNRVPLFEDGAEGSIVQFLFDSRDHGLALVDRGGGALRYETYETETGGQTWTMRDKSGKMIRLKAAPESEWRIRAESKGFRLEHLEDTRWSPFAVFAARVAECHRKPIERTEPVEVKSPDDAVNEIQLKKQPPR